METKARVMKTKEDVEKILSYISFAKSCLEMGWEWQVREIQEGFLIRCSFQRPDVYKDGEIGKGFGRWMFIEKDTPKSGIVKTAWLCSTLIVSHELMEAFEYKSAKIFNPHKSLTDLAHPIRLNEGYET